jgi:uncharacterized protein
MSSMAAIQDFLSHKRLAMVGVSRQRMEFSRILYRELRSRGYDVVPVNPNAPDIDGQKCFARVPDIEPPVDGALLMTPPHRTTAVIRECMAAGVTRIWVFSSVHNNVVEAEAATFCDAKGISLVPGECPMMFLPHTGFIHRAHGFVRKITGEYPR